MSQTFNLPDVGEGLTEADIVSWRVAVGDTVEVNDVICEIETAKSLVELPVPFAGTVEELVADEGQTLEVGQPLIRISAGDGEGPPATQPAAAAPASTPEAGGGQTPESTQQQDNTAKAPAEDQQQALVGSGPKADAPKARPRTRPTALDLIDLTALGLSEEPRRTSSGDIADTARRASPPVRALAKRLGVEVWELVGSGRDGQITRDDVQRQAQQNSTSQDSQAAVPAPGFRLLDAGPREEKVDVRGVRKATALNVAASASSVPHVSVFKEIDVTAIMELRSALRNDPAYEGLAVSPMLFAAKAIIWAARRNRQVNATWHDTHYTLCNYVNLGIAAATPRGLIVPVIHEAQAYHTKGLASAITALTTDAREGKTPPEQMKGGTISITNIGSLGLDYGTPILPPGQAAIVMLGAVKTKPWVVKGQVAVRDIMTIGGSFDHRLIDGDLAGSFISDVAAAMEQPGLLLE